MTVTDADEARVVRLLSHDVAATLGPGYDEAIRNAAAHARTLWHEPSDYVDKVVEDVQQEFHDLFIDTTWPSCPFHPNHPLWLHGEQWVCEQNQTSVAPLGGLRRSASRPGPTR
jgi:hypothetical protein